jgi:hypothetical protein
MYTTDHLLLTSSCVLFVFAKKYNKIKPTPGLLYQVRGMGDHSLVHFYFSQSVSVRVLPSSQKMVIVSVFIFSTVSPLHIFFFVGDGWVPYV